MDRDKLSEIISCVIYKENQKALNLGHDVLCTATEYLADKIAEELCNNDCHIKNELNGGFNYVGTHPSI